ncbi:hypothetical protein [Nocardia sp. No.11]|jgi:hypothetical protein|uniref:DUF6959 family protein n=1 Tax=Nocardia sp. No.11 TaxID=3128861 RepID=UPI00319E6FA8
MEHSAAELVATQGDYSLVRWSGRKFPGLLVQGDTLSILVSILSESQDLLDDGEIDEAKFALTDLKLRLAGMQESYEEMMKSAGIRLPYAK